MSSILVALELDEKKTQILEKASLLAGALNARMHLVHVLKPLDYAYPSALTLGYLNTEMEKFVSDGTKAAEQSLLESAAQYAVAKDHCHVKVGHPVSEVLKLAKELGVQLMVVGSRSSHVGQLFTGSVANGIVQHANTDVYIVKTGERT